MSDDVDVGNMLEELHGRTSNSYFDLSRRATTDSFSLSVQLSAAAYLTRLAEVHLPTFEEREAGLTKRVGAASRHLRRAYKQFDAIDLRAKERNFSSLTDQAARIDKQINIATNEVACFFLLFYKYVWNYSEFERSINIAALIIKCFDSHSDGIYDLITQAYKISSRINNVEKNLYFSKDILFEVKEPQSLQKISAKQREIGLRILKLSAEQFERIEQSLDRSLETLAVNYLKDASQSAGKLKPFSTLTSIQAACVTEICLRWENEKRIHRGLVFEWVKKNLADYIPGITQGHLRASPSLYRAFNHAVRTVGLPSDLDVPTDWEARARRARALGPDGLLAKQRAAARARSKSYRERKP